MSKIFYLPDGGYVTIPDTMSLAEADAKARVKFPEAYGIHQKHGFFPAFQAGLKEGVGSGLSGLGNLTGIQSLQAAGQNMLAPDQTPGAYRPTTDADIAAASKQGVFSGLGSLYSKYVGEPLGGMLGRYAIPTAVGAGAAMLAPEAGAFGLGAAGLQAAARGAGFVAADLPMEQGENVQEQQNQIQQAQARGRLAPEFNQAKTVAASLAQAAMLPILGTAGHVAANATLKALTPDIADMAKMVSRGELSQADATAALQSKTQNILTQMGVRTAEATAVGVPLMTGTEALRMSQAGEDINSPEAQARLGETAKAALALAPLGGLAGAYTGFRTRGRQEQVLNQAGNEWDHVENIAKAFEQQREQTKSQAATTQTIMPQVRDQLSNVMGMLDNPDGLNELINNPKQYFLLPSKDLADLRKQLIEYRKGASDRAQAIVNAEKGRQDTREAVAAAEDNGQTLTDDHIDELKASTEHKDTQKWIERALSGQTLSGLQNVRPSVLEMKNPLQAQQRLQAIDAAESILRRGNVEDIFTGQQTLPKEPIQPAPTAMGLTPEETKAAHADLYQQLMDAIGKYAKTGDEKDRIVRDELLKQARLQQGHQMSLDERSQNEPAPKPSAAPVSAAGGEGNAVPVSEPVPEGDGRAGAVPEGVGADQQPVERAPVGPKSVEPPLTLNEIQEKIDELAAKPRTERVNRAMKKLLKLRNEEQQRLIAFKKSAGFEALQPTPAEAVATAEAAKSVGRNEPRFGVEPATAKAAKNIWNSKWHEGDPDVPSYDQLHPDAKDMLHARLELHHEEMPNKTVRQHPEELTVQDFEDVENAHELGANRDRRAEIAKREAAREFKNKQKTEKAVREYIKDKFGPSEDERNRMANEEAIRSAEEGVDPDTLLASKRDRGLRPPANPSTPDAVHNAITDMMGGDAWNRSKVQIYRHISDVPEQYQKEFHDDTQALAIRGSRAIFVADRMNAGEERGVIMHEVGEHVGIDKLLNDREKRNLHDGILRWKNGPDGVEKDSVLAAEKRIPPGLDDEHARKELIAYTAEELNARGVTPRTPSPGGRFLQRLMDLVSGVIRKLGFGENLTGQDVVDLLHGSVVKELRGEARAEPGGEVMRSAIERKIAKFEALQKCLG